MDQSSIEDPGIPYRFMPMPHELFTEDFINDPIMIRFVVCMMKRISPYSKSVPLKNRHKHLFLASFEFMFGREKFALDAGISPKNAYTRLKQLMGLGYVEEVITKKDSNYSVYRLVTEAFHQIGGQHKGQLVGQKSDQLNEHKQETKTQKKKNVEGTFNVAVAPLSQPEKEDITAISAYCEMRGLDIGRPSVERWVTLYGIEKTKGTISLLISSKGKIRKHEAWMEIALKNNYFEDGKNSEVNSRFAREFREKYNWSDLTITKQYCRHELSKKEYYYKLPQETFQKSLRDCYEQYA